jgi:hypothetical protein
MTGLRTRGVRGRQHAARTDDGGGVLRTAEHLLVQAKAAEGVTLLHLPRPDLDTLLADRLDVGPLEIGQLELRVEEVEVDDLGQRDGVRAGRVIAERGQDGDERWAVEEFRQVEEAFGVVQLVLCHSP